MALPHSELPAVTDLNEDDVVEVNNVNQADPTGRFDRYRKLIGKGAYKEVYQAYDQEEGVEVAWNQIRMDTFSSVDLTRIYNEILILQTLRNDSIINLLYAWKTPGPNNKDSIYFITELMTSGTLKQYISKTKSFIKPKIIKNWCRQILQGLAYLHSRETPVIHRDLKCDNIFINGNNGQAKIGDLGLAALKSQRHLTSVLGTPEFMAPEMYDEKYDEKVDIYAFGLVVLEIATKKYPYCECTNQAQIYKKVIGGIKPAALDEVTDPSVKAFIELCIQFDPKKRPSAAELLAHPFLTQAPPGTTLEENPSAVSSHPGGDSSASLGINDDAKSNHDFDPSAPSTAKNRLFSHGKESSLSPSSTSDRRSKSTASHTAETPAHAAVHHMLNIKESDSSGVKSTVVETDQHQFEISSKLENNVVSKVVSCVVEVVQVQDDEVTLSMQYRSKKNTVQIRFPFHLATDTATDVVSELVKEKLIFEEDEQLIRRKIEEVIRSMLIKQRDAGSEKSFDQKKSSSDTAPPASTPYTSNHSSFELEKGTNWKEEFKMREIESSVSESAILIGSASDLVMEPKPLMITKAVTSPAFDATPVDNTRVDKPDFLKMASSSNFEIPRSSSPDRMHASATSGKTIMSKKSEDIDMKLRQLQEQNLQLFNDFSKTKMDTKRSTSPSAEATASLKSTPTSGGVVSTESSKFPSHSVPVGSISPRSLSPALEIKAMAEHTQSAPIPPYSQSLPLPTVSDSVMVTPAKSRPEDPNLLQSPLIPERYDFEHENGK